MKENILSTLNENLLMQPFSKDREESEILTGFQQIAYGYSKVENALAVLSDLKSNKSYIYNGGVAESLGIEEKDNANSINSIWEDDIFERIHPDDLVKKYLLELHFFHFLKTLPIEQRSDFHIVSNIRMKNRSGEYIAIMHRMFYVSSCSLGNLWLALCLYNHPYEKRVQEASDGIIINSSTGEIIRADKRKYDSLLSQREKEILSLIEKGSMSKDIAGKLSISINTVNRHRQNILEKLRVKNSIEACRIAKSIGLL